MVFKHKFFKDETRALEFNAKVDGIIYFRDEDWQYDIHLTRIEYPEGLKKEFPYLVIWAEA